MKEFKENEKTDVYSIYFLLLKNRLVYIGCTNNLRHRIKSHRITGKSFDTIRYTQVDSKEIALKYEMRLIKYFQPEYNKMGLAERTIPMRVPLRHVAEIEKLVDEYKRNKVFSRIN